MTYFPYTGEIGSIVFGSVTSEGVVYVLESLDGWDSPVSTGQVEARTYGHGGWASKAFLAPRVMTANVAVHAPTPGTLDGLITGLLSAIPLDDFADLTVTRDGLSRLARVRQDGDPVVTVVGPQALRVAIPLIAADPFRYSAAETTVEARLASATGGLTLATTVPFSIGATVTSGGFTAANSGNANAPVRVTIHGPCDSPTVSNVRTGKHLTYNGTLLSGEFVEIDLSARSVLLQGQATRRGLVSGDFWDLLPGDSPIAFTALYYEPDARAVFSWRSAWK